MTIIVLSDKEQFINAMLSLTSKLTLMYRDNTRKNQYQGQKGF